MNLQDFKTKLNDLSRIMVSRIESSPLVEKAMMRYETLDQQRQRWLKAGLALAVGLLIIAYYSFAVLGLISEKRELALHHEVIDLARSVYQIPTLRLEPARPVEGIEPLEIGNGTEFPDFIVNHMERRWGIASGLSKVTARDEKTEVVVDSLTLRQLSGLLHQIDGWYPKVQTLNFDVSVPSENKELLKLTMILRVDLQAVVPTRQDYTPSSEGSDGSPSQWDSEGGDSGDTGMRPDEFPTPSDLPEDYDPPPPFEDDVPFPPDADFGE